MICIVNLSNMHVCLKRTTITFLNECVDYKVTFRLFIRNINYLGFFFKHLMSLRVSLRSKEKDNRSAMTRNLYSCLTFSLFLIQPLDKIFWNVQTLLCHTHVAPICFNI